MKNENINNLDSKLKIEMEECDGLGKKVFGISIEIDINILEHLRKNSRDTYGVLCNAIMHSCSELAKQAQRS